LNAANARARRGSKAGGGGRAIDDLEDMEAQKAAKAMPPVLNIGVTQTAHRLGVYPETLYRYIPAE
jgi:hypothetical protein